MDEKYADVQEAMKISSALAERVLEELGQNVFLCYQCVKCTSGCPVGAYFDWQPNQIMRAVQLGQEDIALESNTPWLCASCQTCATRCPQGLDIPAIMEFLTREAKARGFEPAEADVDRFNQAFLRQLRIWGRAYELGLMAEMNVRSGHLTSNMDLGLKMLGKRKVSFLPSPAHPHRRPDPLPGASKAIAYYPGCSLHSTAREFNESAQAVCEALDIALIEPPDWICCGSTAAHRVDPELALRLPAENLALIEQYGFSEVTMPCASCFNRHKAAQYEMRHDPEAKERVGETLSNPYQDSVRVTSLITAIHEHAGLDNVAERVRKPLTDLRLVCYYGCLLTRPPKVTEAKQPENPTDMDELLAATGAEILDWSYKTTCCGAAHSLTRPEIVLDLSRNLIEQARAAGADAIAVACPLCHTNLDARQFQMGLDEPMPVLYFTQLLALALDLPDKQAALHKNLVDPRPLLREKGLLAE